LIKVNVFTTEVIDNITMLLMNVIKRVTLTVWFYDLESSFCGLGWSCCLLKWFTKYKINMMKP